MKNVPSIVKDKYEILGVIGEGSYGVVLKGRKKDSNATVAIKQFKQAPGHSNDMDIIERELKILQSLRFENVVELIEWFRDKKQCFLVFEYVEWNMLQVLQEHPDGLALEQVRYLSYQLFCAINWCHSHEIIHRDIKPENLLISKNSILKLCDFGFARFCNTQASADYYTDYVATRWYRPPELLIGSPYGKPVDIWGCGCIIAELSTGQALFPGTSDLDQLYRIQKCLGPLPSKYVEIMKHNSYIDCKMPPIRELETLEQRYAHIFSSDIMDLFKGTLRLYAPERLTAEACVNHGAFAYLHQKRKKRMQRQQRHQQHQQHQRSKTALSSFIANQPYYDHTNETAQFAIPFVDSHLSKWYDENFESQIRRRTPTLQLNGVIDNSTDVSFTGCSSVIPQPIKNNRCNTQMTDRSANSNNHRRQNKAKDARVQSRDHSTSSDERLLVVPTSSLSSNDITDDDADPNNIFSQSRLSRKYVKNRQQTPPPLPPTTPNPSLSRQHSLREQPITSSSSQVKLASNGVLLRPKQNPQLHQQHSNSVLQLSSKDKGKKSKRFTLDTVDSRSLFQYQIVPNNQQYTESNMYRSPLAIVPNLNSNVYGVQVNNNINNTTTSSYKQPYLQTRDESNVDVQHRPKTRDVIRSRTIDCYTPNAPSLETTPILQRAASRQTVFMYHQMGPEQMDQADVDTTVSTNYSTSRSIDPHCKTQWNNDQRKSTYTSDSHLLGSTGYNTSFNRSFNSTKNDYSNANKIPITPQRDSSYEIIKSAKPTLKQNMTSIRKIPIDPNQRQQSNSSLFGVYPFARTAILHVANAIIPTSHKRHHSIRLPSTKSRQQDR